MSTTATVVQRRLVSWQIAIALRRRPVIDLPVSTGTLIQDSFETVLSSVLSSATVFCLLPSLNRAYTHSFPWASSPMLYNVFKNVVVCFLFISDKKQQQGQRIELEARSI